MIKSDVMETQENVTLPRLMEGKRTGAIYMVYWGDTSVYKALVVGKPKPETNVTLGKVFTHHDLTGFSVFHGKVILENE